MLEKWKAIDNFDGLYEVSNLGKVRIVLGNEKKEILQKRHNRYLQVCLINKEKYYYVAVHTLVARAFVPNPDNKSTVDHINGNRFDNRADNLRWTTKNENVLYSLLLKPDINMREWKLDRLKRKVESELQSQF